MEMLKKSGIVLALGGLMIASVPTTTNCLNLPQWLHKAPIKQSHWKLPSLKNLNLKNLNLSAITSKLPSLNQDNAMKALAAVAVVGYGSLVLLHCQKYLPEWITKKGLIGEIFKRVIGTPKIDKYYVLTDSKEGKVGKVLGDKEEVAATGLVGRLDEVLSSIKYANNSFGYILALLTYMKLSHPSSH